MAVTWHRLEQWLCGLHGHDSVLHFERNRVWLECVTCGYASCGWTIQPRVRDPSRARLVHARAAA
jgi:hypothetical protein